MEGAPESQPALDCLTFCLKESAGVENGPQQREAEGYHWVARDRGRISNEQKNVPPTPRALQA